jgi:hypothetical protein
MKLKLSALFLIIASLCSSHSLAVTTKTSATVASPCVVGHTAPSSGFWMWPANSQVKIYLRAPDFSERDVTAVRVAVHNWDESAMENGSNVRFSVAGLTLETKIAAGAMTLVRGDVFDKQRRHLALLQAHSLKVDQLIDYAVLIVDFKLTNPEVLTNVMAHEIGHSLGLLDCVKCSSRSTAMGLMKGNGESNGIEGPTACDKAGVSAAYRELLARVGPSPATSALNQLVVDEGEEPEEDDTAVVKKP